MLHLYQRYIFAPSTNHTEQQQSSTKAELPRRGSFRLAAPNFFYTSFDSFQLARQRSYNRYLCWD